MNGNTIARSESIASGVLCNSANATPAVTAGSRKYLPL